MGALSGALRLLSSLFHDETASMAFVGLPDTAANLIGRPSRQLGLLARPRAQRGVRPCARSNSAVAAHLPHVASRGLVELLVLLVLSLHQLASERLPWGLHGALLVLLVLLHATSIAGLLLLLRVGLLLLLLLEEVTLCQFLLHLQLLLLLRKQLRRHLRLRVQLHLQLLQVLRHVLVWCFIL